MEPPNKRAAVNRPIKEVTDGAILRARAADIHAQRCLVENCSSKRAIMPTHALDRVSGAMDRRATALEWNWNMQRNTLNLDTRRNIFFLGASVRQLYEEKRWGLLPEDATVYQYFDETRQLVLPRAQFPTTLADSFNYRLIPIQGMDEVYLTRQTDSSTGGRPTITIHHPPFADLPSLTSHIDPKFAILQLGLLLASPCLDAAARTALIHAHPLLCEVERLCAAWLRREPRDAAQDPTYILPLAPGEYCDEWDVSEPSSDGDSMCTPKRRIRGWVNEEDKEDEEAVMQPPLSPSSETREVLAAELVEMTLVVSEPGVPDVLAQPAAGSSKSATTPAVPHVQKSSLGAASAKEKIRGASGRAPTADAVHDTTVAPGTAVVEIGVPPPRRVQPTRGAKNPKKRGTEEDLGLAEGPGDNSAKRRRADVVDVEIAPEKGEVDVDDGVEVVENVKGKGKARKGKPVRGATSKRKEGNATDDITPANKEPEPAKKRGRPRRKGL